MDENPYKAPSSDRHRRRRHADEFLIDVVAIATGALVIGGIIAASIRIAFLLPAA